MATAATPPNPYVAPNIFDQKYGIIQGLNEQMADVSGSIAKLATIKSLEDATIIEDYKTLNNNIKLARDTYATTDFTTLTNSLTQFQNQKAPLDARRDSALAKAYERIDTPFTFMKTIQHNTLDNFLAICMYSSAFLAGISMSHLFLTLSLIHRVFYFILGIAFFPFVLIYTLYNPPLWRSAVFPLFQKGEMAADMERATFGFLTFYPPNPIGDKEIKYTRTILRGLSGFFLFMTGGTYWLLNRPASILLPAPI